MTCLREKYLEVDNAGYDTAILSEIDLKGLNPDAPEGKGTFTGSLRLHGMKKTVTGPGEIRQTRAGLQVKASFPLNLFDYNIPEPQYLGIGVKHTVRIEVDFTVTQRACLSARSVRFGLLRRRDVPA